CHCPRRSWHRTTWPSLSHTISAGIGSGAAVLVHATRMRSLQAAPTTRIAPACFTYQKSMVYTPAYVSRTCLHNLLMCRNFRVCSAFERERRPELNAPNAFECVQPSVQRSAFTDFATHASVMISKRPTRQSVHSHACAFKRLPPVL
ncbi:hypothetical protein AZE42_07500, partial [Rhizopogon vesiculosus]